MEAIFSRRSVRQFTNERISAEKIEMILKAAMRAPSAGNEKPWEFIVVTQQEIKEKMAQSNPYAKMIEKASHAIVVCGDLNKQRFDYDFWVQDCSAATQNILLEATYLGIGTVWIGTYPIKERVEDIQAILNLPESVVPLSVVALGYPAEKSEGIDTFNPERIHNEKW